MDDRIVVRRMYASRFVSSVGEQIYYIAIVSALYLQTSSALVATAFFALKGLVHMGGLLTYLPVPVEHQKAVLVFSDVLRGVLVLLFIPALSAELTTSVLALVVVLEAVQVVYGPGRVALTNRFAAHDRHRANVSDQVTTTIALTLGLAIGGLATHYLSAAAAVVVNSATFFASAGLLTRVPRITRDDGARSTRLRTRPLRWVKTGAPSRAKDLTWAHVLCQIPVAAFNSLIVVKVLDLPSGSEASFGLVESGMGIGLLIGSITAFRIRAEHRYRAFWTSLLTQGFLFLLSSATRSLWSLGLLLFLAAICNMLCAAMHRSMVVEGLASDELGTGWLVYRSGTAVLGGGAGALAGLLSDSVGIGVSQATVAVVATAMAVAVPWWIHVRSKSRAVLPVHAR